MYNRFSTLVALLLAPFPLLSLTPDPPTTLPSGGASRTFSFTLPAECRTSAGVFDKEGNLVRTLWRLRPDTPGEHTETWDGTDETGAPAPPGSYRFKVVWNPGKYEHVASIGNIGDSLKATGHTPSNMLDVMTDGHGGIYTVNGWDEAGADFKKWNREGKSIYDARFQIRNGKPYGIGYSLTHDDTYFYCGTTGFPTEQSQERQKIRRYRLSDGKQVPFTGATTDSGHIRFMDWPSRTLTKLVGTNEWSIRSKPLRALAVIGDTLLVGDALNDQVFRYDKTTGEQRSSFALPLPRSFAVDRFGAVWVLYDRHKLGRIRHPLADSPDIQTVRTDIGEAETVSLAPDGRVFVADSGTGQVRIFSSDGTRELRTFGTLAKLGDAEPDHFYRLRGVSVDSDGSFVTIQTMSPTGARLARWSAEGKLLWERLGTEFVSSGNYSADDPSTLYSFSQNRYHLTEGSQDTWKFTGNLQTPSVIHGSPAGSLRILRLQGQKFAFLPTGDGVQIYKLKDDQFHLSAMVGGCDPLPNGSSDPHMLRPQWTWHDANGTGRPKPEEIEWFKQPKKGGWSAYTTFGMNADSRGNLWYCSMQGHIHKIPLSGWDAQGNPLYDWAKDKMVIPTDRSPMKFAPTCVQCDDEGNLYVIGWNQLWPAPKNNPFWMGGLALVSFDSTGHRKWMTRLPRIAVGLDLVPGGGIVVGAAATGAIEHFSSDGLLLGIAQPGTLSGGVKGWLDNNGSISVNRNPNDHKVDVFAEEDVAGRIYWYRIDDREVKTISGNIP